MEAYVSIGLHSRINELWLCGSLVSFRPCYLQTWTNSSKPAFFRLFQPCHRDVLPCFYLLKSALWRKWISTMAVCRLNAPIHAMDDEFSSLISTDLPSCVYSLFFGCKMAAGTLSAATLYIPASFRIMNDMMRRTCHIDYPLCAFGQQVAQPSASK